MEGKEGTVIAENAAEVLAAIARARMPPLTYVLGSQDSIKALIGLCSSSGTKTQPLVQVLYRPAKSRAAAYALPLL